MERVYALLRDFYKNHKAFLFSYLFILICQDILALVLPELTGELINSAVYGSGEVDPLIPRIAVLLGLALLLLAFITLKSYLALRYETIAISMLKQRLLTRLNFIKFRPLREEDSGHFNRVINSDTDNIRSMIFRDPFGFGINILMCLAIIIMMANLSVPLMLISLMSVVLILVLSHFLIPLVKASNRQVLRINDDLSTRVNLLYRDDLNIKSHNIRETVRQRNQQIVDELQEAEFHAAGHDVLYENVAVSGVNNVINIVLYGAGAYLVIVGRLQVGFLASFIAYYTMLWEIIQQLTQLLMYYNIRQNSAIRIEEMLRLPYEDRLEEPAISSDELYPFRSLTLQDVSYQIDDDVILEDVNMEIETGDSVLCLGPNGSGKSSMGRLIAKISEHTGGNILYNGHSYDRIQETDLRSHIVFVPAESASEGFLYDEIEFSPDFTDEFHQQMTADRHLEHSSGEKKYRQIKIALQRDADFYIFDEPTAFADDDKEQEIMQMIHDLPDEKTVIVITQDGSHWKGFNKTFYIEDQTLCLQESEAVAI